MPQQSHEELLVESYVANIEVFHLRMDRCVEGRQISHRHGWLVVVFYMPTVTVGKPVSKTTGCNGARVNHDVG